MSSRGLFANAQQGENFTVVALIDENHALLGGQTTWNGFRYENLSLAETYVAFSVAMSQNYTSSANPLIYDTEVLNVGIDGPGYDMTTGIFTCQ